MCCITNPEFVVVVECVEELDDVAVVALRQDVDLHDVVLQLVLAFRLDDLGCSQSARLLVLGLEDKTVGLVQQQEPCVAVGIFHNR